MTQYPEQETNTRNLRERISIWLPLLLSLAMAGGVWIGFHLQGQSRSQYHVLSDENGGGVSFGVGKVEEVLRFVDARYLEGVEIDKLEAAAIEGMLKKLDPHSSYIPAEELQSVNESLAGGFEGIGVEFFVLDDTVQVVGVIPGGPSDQAGIQVGDKFVMIGDSVVAGIGIKNKDIINKLKGKGGTPVDVKVKRWGEAALKSIRIVRDEIPMRSVDVAYMLDDKTGFIKINRFSSKTADEFLKSLHELMAEGTMEDLVIDLRHNPGGYLNAATDILKELFSKKTMLVYTEGRSYKRRDYYSDGKPHFRIGKVAVLIDEGSASASEILAGAVQDNDRGIIVGRRSYGKGLVQEQYDLSDGSALRLTVARYYTPSGRLIQKPYDPNHDEVYDGDLEQRFLSGELYNKDSIKVSDSTKYQTTGGRTVYGGGGIIPDVFVPLDTFSRNDYFNALQGEIAPFIYRYFDQNHTALKNYKTVDDYLARFNVDDAMFTAFLDFAAKQGTPKNEADARAFKKRLSVYLKAYLGQQLFREMGLYRVLHSDDKTLLRALEELQGKGGSAMR